MQQNFLDPLLPVAFQDQHGSPGTSLCRGGGKATAWADCCKPTGTLGMGDSSAPLGISAHQPPFHCAHSFTTEGSSQLCPLPTAPCLQLSMVGGLHPPPASHPKRDLPTHWWLFANPSAHSSGFHCPTLLCRAVLPHPFLSVPLQSLQCEGPVGCPRATTGLSTLHWVSRCSRGWEPSGSAPPGPLLHFSGMG